MTETLTDGGEGGARALLRLLEQMQKAADAGLYYLALFAALTVPDICGALGAGDGRSTAQRYEAWFDKYVEPGYGNVQLRGADCYKFRCRALHQGFLNVANGDFARLIFIEPGSTSHVMHMNRLGDALNIDVRFFVDNIGLGVHLWLRDVQGTEPFETNAAGLMQQYPNGLSPYIVGVPVIA